METEISKQDAIKYLERKSFPGWDACSDKPTVSLSELGFMIKPSNDSKIILDIAYKCTQEEAKKFPQFRWVSLEEL